MSRFFECGEEYIKKQSSAAEYAQRMLGEFMGHIQREIRGFENLNKELTEQ